MPTTALQYLHIAQFYETIFLLIIIIPLGMQVLLFKNQLWVYINLKRVEENAEHDQWVVQNQEIENSEIQRQIEEIESDSRRQSQGQIKKEGEVNMEGQRETGNENGNDDGNENEKKGEVQPENMNDEVKSAPKLSKLQEPPLTPALLAPADETHERPQLTFDQTRVMYFYQQVVDVYEKYLPIIISVVVMGILTQNCEVFSLAMFFCYIISTFLLDYAEMFQKLKSEYQSNTIAPYVHLVSSGFMLAIFINLFSRAQYSLV